LGGSLDVKKMVWSSLLVALGILLPILFRSIGAGSTFLPMHLPILLAGFILPLPFAIAVAAITPLLSSIFSGMPPYPFLLYMIPELVTYALVISLMYNKNIKAPFIKRIYLPLGIAMIIGRLTASLFQAILLANSIDIIVFFSSTIITCVPGIILQLIVIPIILYSFIKAGFIEGSIA